MKSLFRKMGAKVTPTRIRRRSLQRRIDRLKAVMQIMIARLPEKDLAELVQIGSSPEFEQACAILDMLSEEEAGKFLDMLEDGAPDDLKHLL
jgi:hypothetical protein